MIYITGDFHGDIKNRLSNNNNPQLKSLIKNDFVIVTGDFGLPWAKQETTSEKDTLKWLSKKPYTLLYCDGNHENFDRLNTYPIKEWNGGIVHELAPNVFHLMRGYIYTIDGYKFFVFGGAQSHDIRDGILEPEDPRLSEWKYLRQYGVKQFRINHLEWWAEEMPNAEEMTRGLASLEENDWRVDYIISHDMPTSTLNLYNIQFHSNYKNDVLNDYLEEIRCKTDYKRWFFGHYHTDRNITDKETALYYEWRIV